MLLENHESLPWRRRAFEREAVLDKLCQVGGFPKDWLGEAEGGENGSGSEDVEKLAEVLLRHLFRPKNGSHLGGGPLSSSPGVTRVQVASLKSEKVCSETVAPQPAGRQVVPV